MPESLFEVPIPWAVRFDRVPPSAVAHAADVEQAIEYLFRHGTSGIEITWSGNIFRIPYAYGLSDSFDAILEMLAAICASNDGHYRFAFTSHPGGIDADWHLSWDVNTVTIAADWRMVPGATANAPTTSRPISTSRTGFIEDWISLARFVQDLVRAVSLDDTASLDTIATIIQQHDDPKLNPTP